MIRHRVFIGLFTGCSQDEIQGVHRMRYRVFIGLCTGCLHDEALNFVIFYCLRVLAGTRFTECRNR